MLVGSIVDLRACLLVVCAAQTPGVVSPCVGKTMYARHAVQGDATVKSPDGTKSVTTRRVDGDPSDPDGWHTSIVVRAGGKRFRARLEGFGSEVLWSPDSQSFVINETTGGGGIGQQAYIFYVEANQLRRVDVSTPVEKAFGAPVKCQVPVPPNTAVLKWLDEQRVLVVAEVVHVSICKCLGTFMSYEVSLPDLQVLRSYTQAETKRLFAGSLGCEFKDADDACAKRWQKPRSGSAARAFSVREGRSCAVHRAIHAIEAARPRE
jgi:hypothetical protein